MDKLKCCAVHHSTGRMHADPMHDTCQNAATVERNGRPYCKRHDPEAKEARAEAKRRSALPREAYNAVQAGYMELESAARSLREIGCADQADTLLAVARDLRVFRQNLVAAMAAHNQQGE